MCVLHPTFSKYTDLFGSFQEILKEHPKDLSIRPNLHCAAVHETLRTCALSLPRATHMLSVSLWPQKNVLLCRSPLPSWSSRSRRLLLRILAGDFACPYRFSANLAGSARPFLLLFLLPRRTSVACESGSQVSLVALSSFVSQQQQQSQQQ